MTDSTSQKFLHKAIAFIVSFGVRDGLEVDQAK